MMHEYQFRAQVLADLSSIKSAISALGRALNAQNDAIKTLVEMENKQMSDLKTLLADAQGVETVLASAKSYEDGRTAHIADLEAQVATLTASQADPAAIQALSDEIAKLKAAASGLAPAAPATGA